MSFDQTLISSPIGRLLIASREETICEILFPRQISATQEPGRASPKQGVIQAAVEQIEAYFDGRLRTFDLPLAPRGTDFQRRVWNELQTIEYGETTSYGEIAKRIGSPRAARAVGAANGRNPIPLVIPCHRVIGADGSLTGFGGGLRIKRALLALEQMHTSSVVGASAAIRFPSR